MKLRKIHKVIIILVSTFVILSTLFFCFFGDYLKYLQPYREGVEYYSDGSYSRFGFGLSKYGKIAAEYLPEYDEVAENAEDIQFVYSGGWGYSKTVDVFVAVKYDEEIYIAQRDEILSQGESFGEDFHIGEVESRHHRLIDKKQMSNGDYVYYVITCCDKDKSIMYSVMFDYREHKDMGSLSIHSHPYYNFFREFHTECMPS